MKLYGSTAQLGKGQRKKDPLLSADEIARC